jgi:hypothetical protein
MKASYSPANLKKSAWTGLSIANPNFSEIALCDGNLCQVGIIEFTCLAIDELVS